MHVPAATELEIPSDPAELPGARDAVRAYCLAHGWPDQQTGEIVLAVDEALANVMRHGYQNARGEPIELRLAMIVQDDGHEAIEIRIRDFGRQVDPETICGRSLTDIRPGGLGVHIIRAMMSSADYQRAEGGGMLLVLRKRRDHLANTRDTRGSHA